MGEKICSEFRVREVWFTVSLVCGELIWSYVYKIDKKKKCCRIKGRGKKKKKQ